MVLGKRTSAEAFLEIEAAESGDSGRALSAAEVSEYDASFVDDGEEEEVDDSSDNDIYRDEDIDPPALEDSSDDESEFNYQPTYFFPRGSRRVAKI